MSEQPRYEVDLESAQGSVIGDRPHVEQHFHGSVTGKPQVTYWLGRPDSLGGNFVGREDDLKAINSALSDKRTCVVCGIAACGKTRLAAEFAHQWDSDGLWSTAGSTVALTLRALTPAFGIHQEPGSDDDIASEVAQHLVSLSATILWVIDNLPDLDLMNTLLPLTGNVRILATTRDNRPNLLPPNVGFVDIRVLSPETSVELLCSRSGTDREHPLLPEIVERVGYLPLALESLAVRLAEPLQSPEKVLAEIRKAATALELQTFQDAVGVSIPRADGVFRTITGTLDRLPEETRRAISCLGYIADAPVPQTLAMALTGLDDDKLGDLLTLCARESVLSCVGDEVTIHALTAAAIAVTNPDAALLRAESHFRDRLETTNTDDPVALRSEVVHHEHFLDLARKRLGSDHEYVMAFADNLAIAYRNAGRPNEAIPILEETLKVRERILGLEHPDTLSSRNDLANAYGDIGRHDEAIPILEETLKVRERVLGPEHPYTLSSRNNLAIAYGDVGRHDEAIPILEETLKVREHVLSPEHPDTLSSRHNLANAYGDVGRHGEAIPILEETLKVRERVLGPEHPDTLSSCNGLAITYRDVGRPNEAILIHEETLKVRERILGLEHPDTLSSRNNLAIAYGDVGRHDEAIPILEETLKIIERVLGPEHPDTLSSRNNLAIAYRETGRLNEAIPILEETLKVIERVLGPEHPDTLSSRNNLAIAYRSAGRQKDAHKVTRKPTRRPSIRKWFLKLSHQYED